MLSIFNRFMQGANTFPLRWSLYRHTACVRFLRCRSVKLGGCESLQRGSSALLCTHRDAVTTVPIGNTIATTLTKWDKNRCAEFLRCRVSLSYSLSAFSPLLMRQFTHSTRKALCEEMQSTRLSVNDPVTSIKNVKTIIDNHFHSQLD